MLMSAQADPGSSAAIAVTDDGPPDAFVVETRFGNLEFRAKSTIVMPHGMPGFPGPHSFGLANLADERLAQFKLFQCLDDTEISFLVLPVHPESAMLEPADVAQALDGAGIAPQDASILLIVSVRKAGDRVAITVNMRAPVLVDTRRQVARQVVLSNSGYSIRHAL